MRTFLLVLGWTLVADSAVILTGLRAAGDGFIPTDVRAVALLAFLLFALFAI